jgi:hypothetical protein
VAITVQIMDEPMGCGPLSDGCTDKMLTEACPGAHSASRPAMYQTLVLVVFMKLLAPIAAARYNGSRESHSKLWRYRLDQFDATVTVMVAVVNDWGFQTFTVSWSPATNGHAPF